jgi:hypothetical protein
MLKPANCIGALLAFSLTACATSPKTPPDAEKNDAAETEKTAAMIDYNNCVMGAARKLDDGSYDASLIAMVVQQRCKDQFSRYVAASGAGMGSKESAALTEGLEQNQTQLTTEIIQKMRLQRVHQN